MMLTLNMAQLFTRDGLPARCARLVKISRRNKDERYINYY